MPNRSLSVAATGMQAQQLNVDVISNNIANLSTTAYKRQRAEFSDLLYQNYIRAGSSTSSNNTISPTGIQLGAGVKTGAIYRINEQGTLTQTNNPLDVAIKGDGYFQVTLPDGSVAYTRAGSFQLNDQGQIVNPLGYPLVPNITIPQTAIGTTINSTGQVSITLSAQVQQQLLGQFDMVRFINPAGLETTGDNLYLETQASGAPVTGFAGDPGFGTIQQNFLEQSNVDVVTELTTLISAQRSYETNSNVIKASDQMLQTANQINT